MTAGKARRTTPAIATPSRPPAADSSTLWVIPAGEARNLTMQYPILGWGLLQTYGRRLVQVENLVQTGVTAGTQTAAKLTERVASVV